MASSISSSRVLPSRNIKKRLSLQVHSSGLPIDPNSAALFRPWAKPRKRAAGCVAKPMKDLRPISLGYPANAAIVWRYGPVQSGAKRHQATWLANGKVRWGRQLFNNLNEASIALAAACGHPPLPYSFRSTQYWAIPCFLPGNVDRLYMSRVDWTIAQWGNVYRCKQSDTPPSPIEWSLPGGITVSTRSSVTQVSEGPFVPLFLVFDLSAVYGSPHSESGYIPLEYTRTANMFPYSDDPLTGRTCDGVPIATHRAAVKAFWASCV